MTLARPTLAPRTDAARIPFVATDLNPPPDDRLELFILNAAVIPATPLPAWTLEVDYLESRADYGIEWDVGYDLRFDGTAFTVTTRITLLGDSPGSLPIRWEQGIEQTWNVFALTYGGIQYAVRFDAQFVSAGNQHYDVTVIDGPGRDDLANWYTEKASWGDAYQELVAAHEYGHMIGTFDEYSGGATLNKVTRSGTLMADLTAGGVFPYYLESIEKYAEIGAGGSLDFTVERLPLDVTAPTVLAFSPAAGATEVPLADNIVVTFSEWVYRGAGTLTLRNAGGSLIESFEVATSPRLHFASAQLTIDPTLTLQSNTTYTLTLTAGSVEDTAGNPLAAPATLSFTTEQFGNGAPVGRNAAYTVSEDQSLSGTLPTAVDPEGATVTYRLESATTQGTVVVQANGSFTYTPKPDYAGSDRFTFTARDPQGAYNTYAIDLDVQAVNDLPTVADASHAGLEDRRISGLIQVTDADMDSVRLAITTAPAHGSATISSGTRRFTYIPDADFAGTDVFVVTGDDGHGGTDTATIVLTIQPINDPPSSAPTILGSPVHGQTLRVGSAPSDPDGIDPDSLVYQWSADGLEIAGATGDSLLLGLAQVGRRISVEARYQDLFGTAERIASAATLPVVEANASPVASDAGYATAEDVPLSASLPVASDADGDPVRYLLDTGPSHGVVELTTAGSFVYRPALNYAGPDAFTYRVADALSQSRTYTATLEITAVNDPPNVSDATFAGREDTALTRSLGVSDVDGDPLLTTIVQGPTQGIVTLSSRSPTFTYTPNADFAGTDRFVFSVADGRGGTRQATITVQLEAVNDPPGGAPVIDGTPAVSETLRVASGPSDADGIDLASLDYQWRADGLEIPGATGAELRLDRSLIGRTISVEARYTDLGGTSERIASAESMPVADDDRLPVAPSGLDAIDALTAGVRWKLGAAQSLRWSLSRGVDAEPLTDPAALRAGIEALLEPLAEIAGVRFVYAGIFESPAAAAAAGSVLNVAPSADRSSFASVDARAVGFGPALAAGVERYPGQAGDLFLSTDSLQRLRVELAPEDPLGVELMRELLRALGVARMSPATGTPWPDAGLAGSARPDLSPLASLSDLGVTTVTPRGPLLLDLLALQHLYGVNTATGAGHDPYTLSTHAATATRWDAGGSDTVSAAQSEDAWTIALSAPIEGVTGSAPRTGWALPSSAAASLQGLQWFVGALEHAVGSGFDDWISGNELANTLAGQAGADTLTGGGGDDRLDGGAGLDLARYAGALDDYVLEYFGNGVAVTDLQPQRDGSDRLEAVERLQFADLSVNLTLRSAAASIDPGALDRLVELYIGFFGRVPAADGLAYWIAEIAEGEALTDLAETFYDLGSGPDLRAVTGYWDLTTNTALSDADYVRVIYRNVLAREARPEGVDYWAQRLDSGEATRGSLVCEILDAAHGLRGDAAWGWVAQLLEDRTQMSLTIARDWGLNYGATPEQSIALGRAIADSVVESPNPLFPAVPIKVYDHDAAVALIGVTPDHLLPS